MSGRCFDIREPLRRDVKGVLDEARSEDFDAIVVYGVKDGMATTINSGHFNSQSVIGSLEMIKHHLAEAGRSGV